MLAAWKGVPYAPWLRGSLDGITPSELRGLLSFRDRFRRGATTHVVPARAARAALRGEGGRGEDGAEARRLRQGARRRERAQAAPLVERLEWQATSAAWGDYTSTWSYDEADAARKAEFVRAAVGAVAPRLVWDLGCNDGTYSRIAAERRRVRRRDRHRPPRRRPARARGARPDPAARRRPRRPVAGPRVARRRAQGPLARAAARPVARARARAPPRDHAERAARRAARLVRVARRRARRRVRRPRGRDGAAAPRREARGPPRRLHARRLRAAPGERFDVERSEELAGGRRVLYLARPR